MNINLNDCVYQQDNQVALVSDITKEGQTYNNNLTFTRDKNNKINIGFTKEYLDGMHLLKLPPLGGINDKFIKIKIGMQEMKIKLEGDTIDSSIFDGIDKSLVTSINIARGYTSIAEGAFKECEKLEEVKLPDTIKSIGAYAFMGCESLTSIKIPKGVTSIEECTFTNCHSLEEVNLPDTITDIGTSAFYTCVRLRVVNIPEKVVSVGKWAFKECMRLEKIVLPDTVEYIGDHAFYGCKKLTVNVPKKITSIEEGTFFFCKNIRELELPNTIKEIKYNAFYGCESLREINLPEGLTTIEDQAFCHCHGISKVNFPSTLKTIGQYAFRWCIGLKAITLPNSIEKIEDEAFVDCENLKLVNLLTKAADNYDNLVNGANIKLHFSPLRNSVSVFYSNNNDLESSEKLCQRLFPGSKVINNYLNVEEQSKGVSSKLNWSWEF